MSRDAVVVQARLVARDLHLHVTDDPLRSLLRYCDCQIRGFLKQIPCTTLSDLLSLAANKLGTRFVEIQDDETLEQVAATFRARREPGFADLSAQLAQDVFGITIRLEHPKPGELRFVSLIDCRGPKASRRYFTKWHELAHLFILTDQARLHFFRTHDRQKSSEEQLVDKIAGRYSLYRPFITPYLTGSLTFDKIEKIRTACCPEASREATLIGVVLAWPEPMVFIQARPARRRADQRHHDAGQHSLFPSPPLELRAVRVITNDAAREIEMQIFENMRIPERSLITRAFGCQLAQDEAVEDLSWWETSASGPLAQLPVTVRCRRGFDLVEAMITPVRAPSD